MKHGIPILAAAAFLAGSILVASASAADLYKLDPDHTQTIFTIDHLGYSRISGTFHDIKGTLTFDEKKPETSSVEVTIGTGSVDTGSAARDEDLRSADYFNAATFPAMTFRSTVVRRRGARTADVTGDLTLLGVTKPVVLKVTFNRMAPDFLRGNSMVAGFTASARIKRSDFGMKAFLPLIGDQVDIAINAEGVKQ
ncbi:YceI family protein [Labrys okinawensis]|uniref:YceI family protein n=1 Tax=Labrys okinawensis TaxID=346911 RepID=UPI0039BCDB79